MRTVTHAVVIALAMVTANCGPSECEQHANHIDDCAREHCEGNDSTWCDLWRDDIYVDPNDCTSTGALFFARVRYICADRGIAGSPWQNCDDVIDSAEACD